MDTVARVEELAAERGISMHRLSEICDVPYSTIINTKKRGGQLQVATIERICIGLEIKLSVFFAKDDPDEKGSVPQGSILNPSSCRLTKKRP